MRVFLAFLTMLALITTSALCFAQNPETLGEIILEVVPGTVTLGEGYACTIQDPALAALVAAEGALRWIPEYTPGSGNCFLFTPNDPQDRSQLIAALEPLSCVVLAEPNAVLYSDSEDRSNPSDFYFQTDYWVYAPFSSAPTGLPNASYPPNWQTCTVTYLTSEVGTVVDAHHFADSWNLKMMQADLAWLVEDGDSSVKVAIIDSGVDWRHPDLAPNIWQNPGEDVNHDGTIHPVDPGNPYSIWAEDPTDINCVNDAPDVWGILPVPDDIVGLRFHDQRWAGPPTVPLWDPSNSLCGASVDIYRNGMYGAQGAHGTQMASLIGAAHNGFGCVGVCPQVSIIPINAGWSIEVGPTEPEGPLRHVIGVDEMISALDYAMAIEADIVNISLSTRTAQYPESNRLRQKMEDAAEAGLIICNSAGNDDNNAVHWPSGWDAVLCCAVVRYDLVKAHQSSFQNYVDFCAPSGQKALQGEAEPPEYRGDEVMAAVIWGPPDPYWSDIQLPHAVVTPGDTIWPGIVHTYKQLDGDTSGGAAQLSGAFALLKAHYPNHSREELIAEMVRGAIDVDPFQPPEHPEYLGNLGHGLINPYRSLTEWGGPRASEIADGVVTWSGNVWVSGDYAVPSGCRLDVLPGTTVHIANFDNEHLGADPDKISISANQIFATGTLEAPIRFVPYGPASEGPGAWSLGNSGPSALSVVQLQHCEFIGLEHLAVFGSTDPEADSSFIQNCHFTSPATGETAALQLSAAEVHSSIFEPAWSTYCTGNVRFEGCRVERPALAEGTMHGILWNSGGGGAKCVVENCIFRNLSVGIRMIAAATDSLILDDVLIEHVYGYGPHPWGEIGIDIQGGRAKAKNLTLRGFAAGVSTQGTGKFSAEYSSFTHCKQAAVNQMGDNLMFFGYYVEPGSPLNQGGHNVFMDNQQYNIFNRHRTGTISARRNWWGSPSGPPAGSNVGRVDATNHLLADPGLPPPPDFMVVAEETSPPFSVGRNVPNPFNPVTAFTLTIPRGGGLVRATVFDIRGRAVRRLLNEVLPSGEHRIEFNGKNDVGEALPSGMYLCRFNFRDREEVVKATLVK